MIKTIFKIQHNFFTVATVLKKKLTEMMMICDEKL